MELRKESLLLKLTPTEKELLKRKAAEDGITITELIFSALKIKRRVRKPVSSEIKNLINQVA